MAAPDNLGFEDPGGGHPGEAASWTLTVHATEITIGNVEDFESGWSNTPFALHLGAVTSGNNETFESGWGTYVFAIGASTTGQYESNGLHGFENFETTRKANDYTVTAANPGVFTAAAHGYSNGDHVKVRVVGGTLAAGLVDGQSYTVNNATTNTFTLLLGATPVQTTTTGSGIQTVYPDPAYFWEPVTIP